MKAVNVDEVLNILHKYGNYIFVTDEQKYSSMVDEIANLKAVNQEPILEKIRVEIEALPKTYPFIDHFDTYVKEDDVKKIIDKYRESEE